MYWNIYKNYGRALCYRLRFVWIKSIIIIILMSCLQQTVNEKNATICSGYGSTGDNTQESIQNTSNESNNIQDTSNSDLINSDSFGTNSYGNGQYSQIGEFTKDDEGNEVSTTEGVNSRVSKGAQRFTSNAKRTQAFDLGRGTEYPN